MKSGKSLPYQRCSCRLAVEPAAAPTEVQCHSAVPAADSFVIGNQFAEVVAAIGTRLAEMVAEIQLVAAVETPSIEVAAGTGSVVAIVFHRHLDSQCTVVAMVPGHNRAAEYHTEVADPERTAAGCTTEDLGDCLVRRPDMMKTPKTLLLYAQDLMDTGLSKL